MYPSNNRDYTFPWGLPESQRNLNQFPASSNTIASNFAGIHISNPNGGFISQQGPNTWYPTPWNNNNFNPHHRESSWNQWIPSPQPQPLLQMGIPPPTQLGDLRERILMQRQQRKEAVEKQSEKEVPATVSSHKWVSMQQVPTKSSHASQSTGKSPLSSTDELAQLRNYKYRNSLAIPSKNKKVRPHFLAFKEVLKEFLVNPNSSFFGSLVKELIMCSKSETYLKNILDFMHANLDEKWNPGLAVTALSAPHVRMRMFWILGEIYRPEYNSCFLTVRTLWNADELFQSFLMKYTMRYPYANELQALWWYWKKFVPRHLMDKIRPYSNEKSFDCSTPDDSKLEPVYAKIFGCSGAPQKTIPVNFNVNHDSSSREPKPQKSAKEKSVMKRLGLKINETMKLDSSSWRAKSEESSNGKGVNATLCVNFVPLGQRLNETVHLETDQVPTYSYRWPAKFCLPPATSVTPSKPVWHEQPQDSMNCEIKIAKLMSLLDKLVTVDRRDVPKAASELLFCFLEHGSDHQLSDRISKKITKFLQETSNNNKIIRILWVIGYLFFPKYESKLTAIKPLMEKIAARLFWFCLRKTHKDPSTREEMRVIFKLWREIVPEDVTSSIIARIKDTDANDPNANWILNDKNIRKGTRIVDFYANKYLTNASTAGPKSRVGKKTTSAVDSDHDIILLDKCDVIQSNSSNQQKNWENKLAGKQKSDESLDAQQKFKKRKIVTEEGTDKIFTEFHRIPSKPVNFVKPVVRSDATKDDTLKSNITETGDNFTFNSGSSGSGNQEYQQSGGPSKLELFRKKMEKDAAIASIGGGHKWNDSSLRENKEIYLRKDWTVDEFVYCVCSEEFRTSWDIVQLNGELRVKIRRK